MLITGTCWIPALGVTAVAAAADIGLQPGAMADVVRCVEAVQADDARRVFLTVFALPSYITLLERLGADSKRQIVVPDPLHHLVWLVAIKENFLRSLEVALLIIVGLRTLHLGFLVLEHQRHELLLNG